MFYSTKDNLLDATKEQLNQCTAILNLTKKKLCFVP